MARDKFTECKFNHTIMCNEVDCINCVYDHQPVHAKEEETDVVLKSMKTHDGTEFYITNEEMQSLLGRIEKNRRDRTRMDRDTLRVRIIGDNLQSSLYDLEDVLESKGGDVPPLQTELLEEFKPTVSSN